MRERMIQKVGCRERGDEDAKCWSSCWEQNSLRVSSKFHLSQLRVYVCWECVDHARKKKSRFGQLATLSEMNEPK